MEPKNTINTELVTLLRVENTLTETGLWYSGAGARTNFIQEILNADKFNFPMDYNPDVANGWFSAVTDFAMLESWFAIEDLRALAQGGYKLFEIKTTMTKTHNGHPIFRKEHAALTEISLEGLLKVHAGHTEH